MPTALLQRGKTLPNEFPDNDTKPSDSGAPVPELWEMYYDFIAITPRSTLSLSGKTC